MAYDFGVIQLATSLVLPCSWLIFVGVLYTRDYWRRSSSLCHRDSTEIPQFSPDICIIESTYGVQLGSASACVRKVLHWCHPLNHFSRGLCPNPCICSRSCPRTPCHWWVLVLPSVWREWETGEVNPSICVSVPSLRFSVYFQPLAN